MTRSPLPIIAVDLPASLLSALTLDHTWLNEDEAWRGVLTGLPNSDKQYADAVREAVRTRGSNVANGGAVGGGSVGWVWLFSVREFRVSRPRSLPYIVR